MILNFPVIIFSICNNLVHNVVRFIAWWVGAVWYKMRQCISKCGFITKWSYNMLYFYYIMHGDYIMRLRVKMIFLQCVSVRCFPCPTAGQQGQSSLYRCILGLPRGLTNKWSLCHFEISQGYNVAVKKENL